MARAVDLFMVYQFIKRLATPFNEWEAYELGIIDEQGNILIDKRERRRNIKMREAFGKFDLLVLKLKKLLEKIPGGRSRLGSYAAALWLIKEHKQNGNEHPTQQALLEYMDQADQMLTETPTVNAGGGAIAGIGVGPDGEPGLTRREIDNYKASNRKKKRKKFIDMWSDNQSN